MFVANFKIFDKPANNNQPIRSIYQPTQQTEIARRPDRKPQESKENQIGKAVDIPPIIDNDLLRGKQRLFTL
jgi:hypothetical protein